MPRDTLHQFTDAGLLRQEMLDSAKPWDES
jgi:hypothetical protein